MTGKGVCLIHETHCSWYKYSFVNPHSIILLKQKSKKFRSKSSSYLIPNYILPYSQSPATTLSMQLNYISDENETKVTLSLVGMTRMQKYKQLVVREQFPHSQRYFASLYMLSIILASHWKKAVFIQSTFNNNKYAAVKKLKVWLLVYQLCQLHSIYNAKLEITES